MTLRQLGAKAVGHLRDRGLVDGTRYLTTRAAMLTGRPVADRLATPIWAADWDVCLILDGCRADVWREADRPDWLGTGSRWSVGAASPEWLSKTFAAEYDDQARRTAYVTANPFSGHDADQHRWLTAGRFPMAEGVPLAYCDEVWRDRWPASEELPTVAPDAVTDRGLAAWRDRDAHGADRLVVHYMQPHVPFRSRPDLTGGWQLDGFGCGGGYDDIDTWRRVAVGQVSASELWRAYRDNLAWVIEEIGRWREHVDGDILVTSDHGNAMGEWGQWGHPPGTANPAVRRVPWVTVTGTGSEAIPPSLGEAAATTTDTAVTDRLAALGYRD